MKVREILELTFTKNIASIAKDHLTIGEKRLREALKAVGCEANKGKRGWTYKGAEHHILDQSIYDFVPVTKGKATNVRTNEQNKQGLNDELERSRQILETMKQQTAVTKEGTNETTKVIRKRASFDIDVQLLKELKVKAVLHDRNVYEIVEASIRKYLNEMD